MLYFVGGLLNLRARTGRYADSRAGRGQAEGYGPPDTPSGARDDGDFGLQIDFNSHSHPDFLLVGLSCPSPPAQPAVNPEDMRPVQYQPEGTALWEKPGLGRLIAIDKIINSVTYK